MEQFAVRTNPRTILDWPIGSGGENKKKITFLFAQDLS
jgi:hypothetical protein